MPKPTQYKFSDFEHRFHELPEGKSYIRSHIGTHNSKSMTGGWNFFNNVKVPWHLTCDEIIFVFQGTFRMVVDGEAYVCQPGDVLWLPSGMEISYEADEKCVIFFAVWPVDWKQRDGVTFVPGVDTEDVPHR